jgi:hypothetical protein
MFFGSKKRLTEIKFCIIIYKRNFEVLRFVWISPPNIRGFSDAFFKIIGGLDI